MFSDVLGNHMLGVGFSVDGGVKDVAASINYLNRSSRWNWGVFGEHVPLLSGTVRSGVSNVNGQPVFVEETYLQRQTYTQTGALTAYPLSRVTRVEFSGAVRRIGFSNEVRTRYYDPFTGNFLGEEKTELASDPALQLYDVSTALVRDTSTFGQTAPVLGQRLRIEVSPTFGDSADEQRVGGSAPVRHAGAPGHAGRPSAARRPLWCRRRGSSAGRTCSSATRRSSAATTRTRSR